MFSWLKKHFIPHEGNEHRPHLLRYENTRNFITFIILLEIVTFLIPIFSQINTLGSLATVLPGVLSDLTNSERQTQNLPILSVNPLLNEAAQMKAEDMATNGYFAHVSPDGKTPWYWLKQAGYNYQYAGENLAVNFSDSQDVTNAWMASPTHRANIVKGNYTEMGTGVATGIYKGQQTIFVVQDYANPMPTQKQTAEKTITAKTNQDVGHLPKQVSDVKTPTDVLGAETVANNILITPTPAPVKNATIFQKLIASPRNATNIIFYIIFGIIFIALLLYILIKRTKHHFDLITNGLVLIALLGAIFMFNSYLTHKNMIVGQSFDYSNQSE